MAARQICADKTVQNAIFRGLQIVIGRSRTIFCRKKPRSRIAAPRTRDFKRLAHGGTEKVPEPGTIQYASAAALVQRPPKRKESREDRRTNLQNEREWAVQDLNL